MSLEIGRGQLDGTEFFEGYYTDVDGDAPYRGTANSPEDVLVMLANLKRKLKRPIQIARHFAASSIVPTCPFR
jgi:hypothetical protein